MLKFPSDMSILDPFVAFIGFDAIYNANGNLQANNISETIHIYMPKGHAINDQLTYDMHQGGSAAGAMEQFQKSEGFGGMIKDFSAEGLRQTNRTLATASGKAFPGADPAAVVALSRGVVSNPHQFTIFKAPALRVFTFNFELIPKSSDDVDAMFKIIKQFREDAYPEGEGFAYTVPKTFAIRVVSQGSFYIHVPDSVIESVSVTYNPTSMSYFKYNNAPAKVNLTLGLKEVRQLTKEKIAAGF